jgi:hypothetical protein
MEVCFQVRYRLATLLFNYLIQKGEILGKKLSLSDVPVVYGSVGQQWQRVGRQTNVCIIADV